MMLPTLAVLGCGNMGGAILRAVATAEPRPVGPILAVDPEAEKRDAFADLSGVTASADPAEAARKAGVVLLAVKPQAAAAALEPLAPVAAGKLFVSVAAGLTTSWLESRLPGGRVVRTMPNTPMLVGLAAVGLAAGKSATAGDLATARDLFPGAEVAEVTEDQMDAVTAVSGSGPAYFFALVEALAAAGVGAGLSPDDSYRLAARTFEGAAALLTKSSEDAATLRRRVTSPGGTTEAALKVFREKGLDAVVRDAVLAATRRGRELAGG